ncbi:hypothetical protein OT109_04880 [Phycisphaeraceae bacterium D3-23]
MGWAIAISLTIVAVVGVFLMRAAQPAKTKAKIRAARCPECNGLGFETGALTTLNTTGPAHYTAKCALCGERISFDWGGVPLEEWPRITR